MRIDEFSAPADIDTIFTQEERTRFSCFGFDIASGAAPVGGGGRRKGFPLGINEFVRDFIFLMESFCNDLRRVDGHALGAFGGAQRS